jgi:signal transduction histidine kinase/branched-subunit amino acid transport protein
VTAAGTSDYGARETRSSVILAGEMRLRVSMRWWLALAFAAVAALTAVAVAEVFVSRAETSFRAKAQEVAAGTTVAAAEAIKTSAPATGLLAATRAQSASRKIALFVFDGSGKLVTPGVSRGVSLSTLPSGLAPVRTALSGNRYLRSFDKGKTIVIGLRLRTGVARAVVGVVSRPELRTELGIVRTEIVPAALIAVAVGAAAGLLVALLIGLRLRRIALAARSIADGRFEGTLKPGFRDELGDLAVTVETMRLRLRDSFAELEAERDRLRRLLERLHEGVVAVDRDLRVIFGNRVAAAILGVASLDDGSELPDPWPDHSLHRFARELFRRDAQFAETRLSGEGDHSYAIVGIPPSLGSRAAVLVFTDVSERERRERAERDFVANAAHELRTPLTAITSAVEALVTGAKDEPDRRDRFLAVIERQTGRLGRLSRALLVLARAQTHQEAIRLEPVRLEPLLNAVAADVVPAAGVKVEVECSSSLVALAQRDLVEQVMSNLAANAAKHVTSGAIILAARQVNGRTVEIEVRDTGPGIPLSEQDRVFDRFYGSDRENGESFGLGLAIVREAVRTLGGVVELDSAPGAGTTIRVLLASGGRAE